ncbi:sugar transferase [Flagellimonas nanhaiensis]|uniref:Sugar transferase n=1 Tax=Flagellimonas nanhaiensis TaxID=2292706 RepID=A0A371JKY6_9FLAO|nr:sugar transferase [Allomuricauda nanhaiensis]RDY57589.1 sugar transferase [Allomuricauda nanhaiensis]
MYQSFFKRLLDISIALTAFLLLSPIFFMLIVLLMFANKGKPFFFQERVGKNNKPFTIIKFKTLKDPKNKGGELTDQAERVTKLGEFIRNSSLDEIPQLINVLKGDMSIVGPRPLLPLYLPLYNDEQARRHCVKPGITGWAQVNGRNVLTWEEKFEHDVWYVDHLDFVTDVKILFKTFGKIFKSDDVYSNDQKDAWSAWKGNS